MSHRILFVDDDENVLAAVQAALRREPYEILTATSGPEGLRLLAEQRVDLVVADERMPGMSGSEFVALVRRRYPETVRLILTGSGDLDSAMRAINEGQVYRYLTKPFNTVSMAATLRQALQEREAARSAAPAPAARDSRTGQQRRVLIDDLERDHPGISDVQRDPSGAIVLDDTELD